MLGLTAPEMAVLVAGLRVLDAGSSPTGVLSSKGVAV
jgi:catalase (peroxidase I)